MALVEHTAGVPRETIVVDNGSTDATRTALPMLEGIRLLRNERDEGFARACNQALLIAQGDVLLLLDASFQMTDGVLPHILGYFEDPAVAVAAPAPESGLGSVLAVRASDARLVGGWDESREDSTEALIRAFIARGRRIEMIGAPPIAKPECTPTAIAPTRCEAPAPPPAAQPGFETSPAQAKTRPPLTVVVPVRDAGSTLGACLESIGRNLGAKDELVIADGGSQDDTLRSAYLYASLHPRQVRVVTNRDMAGLPAAVRQGLDAASGDVLVVMHASMAAPDGFLDGMLQLLAQNPGTDAVGVEVPHTGVCLAGPSALMRRIGGAGPEALFQADGLALAEAVRRAGARLAFVPAGS
jgi:glycosyltransferase involved in cell wall biosynthesis